MRSQARRSARATSATSDLATDAVTSTKIKDGSVAAADLADASITAGKIKDGEVVEGNGRMLSTAVTLPDGAGFTTLLSVPGLGALRASCANGVTTTQWQNTAAGAVTVVNQVVFPTGARACRREHPERRRRRHVRPAGQLGRGRAGVDHVAGERRQHCRRPGQHDVGDCERQRHRLPHQRAGDRDGNPLKTGL